VIVFVAPPQPTLNYVKRIIAEPGDVITIQGTTVIVNGVKLNEPYVHAGYDGNPYAPIVNKTIPKNDYFVMGDDRKNSSDSRDWGFVPRQNIIGRAALVYWPLTAGNSGLLPDYSSVFAAVHSPKANSQSSASLPSGVVHAAPAPLDSTFGMSELLFCALPTGFLVCSKSRKKQ
jgi:signal peptidase I